MTTQGTDKPQKSDGEFASAPPPATRGGTARFGRRRKGKKGPKKGKMFMDIVDDAYAHQVSVSVWREAEAVLSASPSLEEGLSQLLVLGDFAHRGEYAPTWRKNWEEAIAVIQDAADSSERLGIVRGAVTKSINEENEARAQAGQPPVVDDDEGQDFIDYTIDRIIEEADGEIESDL